MKYRPLRQSGRQTYTANSIETHITTFETMINNASLNTKPIIYSRVEDQYDLSYSFKLHQHYHSYHIGRFEHLEVTT